MCFKKYYLSRIIIPTLLGSLIHFGCNNADQSGSKNLDKDTIHRNIQITTANIAGNFSSQKKIKAYMALFNDFFVNYPLLQPFQNSVYKFYKGRDFALAWFDSAGLTEPASNLYNRVQNLQAEGIREDVPYLKLADSLMSSADIIDLKTTTNTDFLLTGIYFYFANRVWGGISEASSRKIDWNLPRKKVDYEAWLDSLLESPRGSVPNEPVYRQYHLLKNALEKYKSISAKNNWSLLTSDKKSYKLGDSSKVIAAIKQRLSLLGDLEADSGSPLFDVDLENAVKSFQRRFGMKEDGVIGSGFIKELNVPIQKRIRQIIVNLERSRWLPDQISGNYLAVNIPEFRLHVYDNDSLLWSCNVVVGKVMTNTVIFSGNLKYVVFSPYWNVPSSILKKEVLPGIRRNKNYLASHHMEWNGGQVRQKPGPWNSLGLVKFLFPNSYSIYLHDTPSKGLFNEDKRAFSHGCIRISEPKKLAMFLLKDDPAWDEKKIVAAMNSGKENYVTLKNTVPVFIAYLTSWVDREGKVNFRDDIYNRDERLAKMLAAN